MRYLLIAATARNDGLIVATLNHADFYRVEGVGWEDFTRNSLPWASLPKEKGGLD